MQTETRLLCAKCTGIRLPQERTPGHVAVRFGDAPRVKTVYFEGVDVTKITVEAQQGKPGWILTRLGALCGGCAENVANKVFVGVVAVVMKT